jgi:hypothetical protein
MTRRKALERWETKVGNCEDTPQTLLLIANSIVKADGLKAPTAVHGPLGIRDHPKEEAKVTADCSEKQLTWHDLCDENHERQVEETLRVQALPASVDDIRVGT